MLLPLLDDLAIGRNSLNGQHIYFDSEDVDLHPEPMYMGFFGVFESRISPGWYQAVGCRLEPPRAGRIVLSQLSVLET
jgi:hypothetical protein